MKIRLELGELLIFGQANQRFSMTAIAIRINAYRASGHLPQDGADRFGLQLSKKLKKHYYVIFALEQANWNKHSMRCG